MLSTSAFNAMLKTLEEPPEFVKFILATTDPQKVPVTVLSRCLQFNLKPMAPIAIAGRLKEILAAESIAAEDTALRLLAQAARGSMRDGLSLLDQAIAYGGGRVSDDAVRGMLGTIDSLLLTRLLDALIARDAPALLALADEMSAHSFSYGQALRDLASLLHRIALAQQTAGANESSRDPARGAADSDGGNRGDGQDSSDDLSDDAEAQRLARQLAPEEVQLYYQIALHGRNELHLAPDEYAGFTMTLLRLLAFTPIDGGAERAAQGVARSAAMSAAAGAANRSENTRTRGAAAPPRTQAAALRSASNRAAVGAAASTSIALPTTSSSTAETTAAGRPTDWPALAAQLSVSGLARELAARSELVAHDGDHFRLRVPLKTLADSGTVERLRDALTAHFGRAHRLSVEVGATSGATAADLASEQRAEQQRRAEEAIYGDPFVKQLIENFGASVDPQSIHPVDVRAGNGTDGIGGDSGQVVEGKQS